MTLIPGSSVLIGSKKGATFGTAVQVGAGDKLEVDSFTISENAEALRDNGIGSGLDMDADSIRGATEPSGEIQKKARFNDAGVMLEAAFWGADSVMNMGSGAFDHSLVFEGTRNQAFPTIAARLLLGSVVELASCTVTGLNMKYSKFPNYLMQVIKFKANSVNYTPSTNTNATITALTVANTKRVIAQPSDYFRINLQTAAALSGTAENTGDVVNITDFEIDLNYDVEYPDEMKGSAGNGQPIASGEAPFQGTVTMTFRGLNDAQYRFLINSQTNTQYKCDMTITGDIIGGAIAYKRKVFFPCLVQVEDPKFDQTSTKVNPVTLKFKCLVVPTAPSGMIHGYPYQIITSDKSTSHLA
jgi:hypothetical protein